MSSPADPQEQCQPQQPTTSGQPPAAAPAAAAAAPQNGSGRSGGCPPHVLAAIYGKQENKQAAYETSLKRWWTGGWARSERECKVQVAGGRRLFAGCPCSHARVAWLVFLFVQPADAPHVTLLVLLQSMLTARTTRKRSMWPIRCCMTATTCRAQRQPQTASPGRRQQQGEQRQQQGRRRLRNPRSSLSPYHHSHASACHCIQLMCAAGCPAESYE